MGQYELSFDLVSLRTYLLEKFLTLNKFHNAMLY